ncbi:MAG: hypothetical protein HOW73_31650 [Polyangiaceae bacterium]|nr:hypothetical protein [Polyangiaceae bacterium]
MHSTWSSYTHATKGASDSKVAVIEEASPAIARKKHLIKSMGLKKGSTYLFAFGFRTDGEVDQLGQGDQGAESAKNYRTDKTKDTSLHAEGLWWRDSQKQLNALEGSTIEFVVVHDSKDPCAEQCHGGFQGVSRRHGIPVLVISYAAQESVRNDRFQTLAPPGRDNVLNSPIILYREGEAYIVGAVDSKGNLGWFPPVDAAHAPAQHEAGKDEERENDDNEEGEGDDGKEKIEHDDDEPTLVPELMPTSLAAFLAQQQHEPSLELQTLLEQFDEGSATPVDNNCLLHTLVQLKNPGLKGREPDGRMLGYFEKMRKHIGAQGTGTIGIEQAQGFAASAGLRVIVHQVAGNGTVESYEAVGEQDGEEVHILHFGAHYVPLWPRHG